MSNNYKVYMHRNKINGKVYVGQTVNSLARRWNNGKGYASCTYFNRAIEKYGWDNFEHILLQDNLSKENADKTEKFYIQKYKSYMQEYGYNISLGGSGLSGATKYKDIYQYTLNGDFIRHYKDMRDVLDNNPNYSKNSIEAAYNGIYFKAYGFQWKSYYKEKIENVNEYMAESGKIKIVYQYDLDGRFISKFNGIKEASNLTGLSWDGISKSCNGRQRTFGDYQWSFDYKEKIDPVDICVICKYGIDGTLIDTYDNALNASVDTGITKSTIINCYSGRYDLAGGYVWKKYNIREEEIPDKIEIKLKKIRLIELIDDDDVCIKIYHSAKEAANDLGFKDRSGIYDVCNGAYKQTHGYRFRYAS